MNVYWQESFHRMVIMKKIFCILIGLCLVCTMANCGVNETIKSNFSETNSVFYPHRSDILETPTRLIYLMEGQVCYYNKLDGNQYVFCFDPLCKHDFDCLSCQFPRLAFQSSVTWCEENNRIYFLRGAKFCSVSFDGSDLKIERSFGEEGSFDQYTYRMCLWNIASYKNRVYFMIQEDQSGVYRLIEYDVIKNTYQDLNAIWNLKDDLAGYILTDTGLYLRMISHEDVNLCHAEYGSSSVTYISDTFANLENGIFDGNTLYFITNTMNAGQCFKTIASYSIDNGKENLYYSRDEAEGSVYLLASTDNFIYFKQRESRLVIYDQDSEGKNKITNAYSRLYRINKQTGEVDCIFDDLSCEILNIYFLNEDQLLIVGNQCIVNGFHAEKNCQTYIAELDNLGNVVSLTEVLME